MSSFILLFVGTGYALPKSHNTWTPGGDLTLIRPRSDLNGSSVTASTWEPEPSTRGTWHLLYTCLFTLILCVYTAIHLNVPKPHETVFELLFRKAKWVLVAVFAPEVVLYAAYSQWYLARDICETLNNRARHYGHQRPGDGERKRKRDKITRNNYSLAYGHYVTMGGIVLDVSDLHDEYSLVTVMPEGIITLAREGQFLEVSDGFIADKSKADGFAKLVVIFQITWMIVQTAARLAAQLPVTILEGHTLVHVVTAFGMYALWFNKPLNVGSPIIVKVEPNSKLADVVALMLVRNNGFGARASSSIGYRDVHLSYNGNDKSESAYLKNYHAPRMEIKHFAARKVLLRRGHTGTQRDRYPVGPGEEPLHPVSERKIPAPAFPEGTLTIEQFAKDLPNVPPSTNGAIPEETDKSFPRLAFYLPLPTSAPTVDNIHSGEALAVGGLGPIENFSPSPGRNQNPYIFHPSTWETIHIPLTDRTVRRWQSAGRALASLPTEAAGDNSNSTGDRHLGLIRPECYFAGGPPSNLPRPGKNGVRSIGSVFWLTVIFFALCTGYGGVHLLAWNALFASEVERILWRVACGDLIAAGVLYFLLLVMYMGTQEGKSGGKSATSAFAQSVAVVLAVGHFVVYVLARVFLVVEAFLSVRCLREGSYEVVSWTSLIPHF